MNKNKSNVISVEEGNENSENATFESLGIVEVLCQACNRLNWKTPTAIQKSVIPFALDGRDIIGLAETGSGKTGAFALPILQHLLEYSRGLFALVLTPTRELAFQIAEQFKVLGAVPNVKTAVIVGGMNMKEQISALKKKPHIVIATPGRLIDHMENNEAFTLNAFKCLVLDEADRILDMQFEEEVNKILEAFPKERNTYLFSATMTEKVDELKRASLTDPVCIEVCKKYQTVEQLEQYQVFLPTKYKDIYLVHILNELSPKSFIVFCSTCDNAKSTALLLHHLGFGVQLLHGKMGQSTRLKVLSNFKSKKNRILVATDVAGRGLDIPHVDVVINFDLPTLAKDYVHRVGRTARAGREGKAITFVTETSVNQYLAIETLIEKKLPFYKYDHDAIMTLKERVKAAQKFSKEEMKKSQQREKDGKYVSLFEDSDSDDHKTFAKKSKKKKMRIK